MDINLMVFLIAVALFGTVAILASAITDLQKQIKADRETFEQIVSNVDGVNKLCGHVLELMNGVVDTLHKEHDLHNQAVNAMREVENKAAEMRAEFEEMLIDIANNRGKMESLSNKMGELTKRLDDFDALKNVSPTLTNSVPTVDDEQLKRALNDALRQTYLTLNANIGSDAYKEAVKEPDESDFSNQTATKTITPENAGAGTMMPDESVGVC